MTDDDDVNWPAPVVVIFEERSLTRHPIILQKNKVCRALFIFCFAHYIWHDEFPMRSSHFLAQD